MTAKKKTLWGADKDMWVKLRDLGLTEDLLPTVCNPEAPISGNSDMKKIGKTPSVYNRDGKVCGIAKWNEKNSTPQQVALWMTKPDYGICLRTKLVRGIDIDIPDQQIAEEVEAFVEDFLGFPIPLRYRENSGKRLLAVRMEADYAKKVLKTEAGPIEMLATGQQFVAAGMHQSGVPYRWDWKGLKDFPTITLKDWEALMLGLELEFDAEMVGRDRLRKRGTDIVLSTTDTTATFLVDQGHVLEEGGDGQLHIDCPFSGEHTSESAISSTSYFPAGTKGYDRGHFICLHAHCEGRPDEEFLDAYGLRTSAFEEIILSEEDIATSPPEYLDRDKHGRPYATLDNVIKAVERPDIISMHIAYDNFLDEIIVSKGNYPKRLLEDTDYVDIRRSLERGQGFFPVSKELVKDIVHWTANQNQVDSLTEWVTAQEWDGVPRVDKFIHTCFGGAEGAYSVAVGRYLWSGLAGRALSPGVKAQMILILKGLQGKLKSSAIAALAPNPKLFTEMELGLDEDKTARALRGKCVVELPELKGLRGAQIEKIKADVVRQVDRYRKLYKENITEYPRRCIGIGTTNEEGILVDVENRRWLPYTVVTQIDIPAIERDRAQLWAEGAVLFKEHGVLWKDAEDLAKDVHGEFMASDTWMDQITAWWEAKYEIEDLDGAEGSMSPADKGWTTIKEVLEDGFNIPVGRQKHADQRRVTDCLRKLGFTLGRKRVNGGLKRVWEGPENWG